MLRVNIFKLMVLNFVILLTFMTSELFAGEWCCDAPVEVLAGKVDPAEVCGNMGNWSGSNRTEEEYFNCALSDLTHYYNYWSVYDERKSIYNDFIFGIIKAYNKYPNIRENISTFLAYKGYIYDKENRKILDSIMEESARKKEWNILKDYADKNKCGTSKLYYNYCDNYFIIGEYVSGITLDEISECQEYPSLHAYGGNIKCVNAQAYIMNKIIEEIIDDKKIKLKYLYLLESHRIKYIKNTIFAKHGREFNDKKIQDFFNKKDWYRVNRIYSDSLLSSVDRENLAIVLEYQSKK